VEPIPETVEAIEEYGPFGPEDLDLIADLRECGRQVQELVPDCIGFSVASEDHGVTFTLMADNADVAVLDAVQYLSDGPCVAAVEEQRHAPAAFELVELLDEESWQLFARASAAKGVRSTLTLPVLKGRCVVGSVNLYGGSGSAFCDHHEELAALFDAWAPGAVTNADLSFTTLSEARRAPQVLKDEVTVQVAVGILVAREGLEVQVAERNLRDASVRAGVRLQDLARAVLEADRGGPSGQRQAGTG
jgi:ANTAR domain-containing protein